MTSTGIWYPPKGLQMVWNYAIDILPLGQPQNEDSLNWKLRPLAISWDQHPLNTMVNSFKRMRSTYNGILHSRSYERVHCRNSFTLRVRTRENTQEYGHIEFFFKRSQSVSACL